MVVHFVFIINGKVNANMVGDVTTPTTGKVNVEIYDVEKLKTSTVGKITSVLSNIEHPS